MSPAVSLEPILPKLVLLLQVQQQLSEEAQHFEDGPPLPRLHLQTPQTQVVQEVPQEVSLFVYHFQTELIVDDAS